MKSIRRRIYEWNEKQKNKPSHYAIVNENGKIIEKYRLSLTARTELIQKKKTSIEKLKIIRI